MDSLFLLAFLGLLGGATLLWIVLSPGAKLRRALRKMPVTPIAEVQDGQVAKIVGILRPAPAEPLVDAPLTGRKCAYWEAFVTEKQPAVQRGHNYVTVIEDRDFCRAFMIEDSTGRAVVEVVWPRVVVTTDTQLHSSLFSDADERCQAFISRHRESSEDLLLSTLTYREGVLEEGEVVAVVGQCQWELDPDPPGGYRARPMRLRIAAADDQGVVLSDDPACI